MWFVKDRGTSVPNDVGEAQELRAKNTKDLQATQQQAPYVARITNRLINRRTLNHFGEDIQVTFTPKGQ